MKIESIFVDEKFSREDFFKKMRIFFLYVAQNISSGNQLLHWELIIDKCLKFISTNFTDESLMSGMKSSVTNKSSNEKLVSENNAAQEIESPSITKNLGDSENR